MPQSSRQFLLRVGIPVLALVVGLQLGMRYERTPQGAGIGLENVTLTGTGRVVADPQREVDIGLLWDVWKLLNVHYIEPQRLQPRTMVLGAVQGMVQSLGDPYTVFMTQKENDDFRSVLSGKLQGIGAELALRDGAIVVVAPLKGSPAERAGLLPNDFVEKVNGQAVDGLSLTEVVSRIRGLKGTTVELTVLREGAPVPLTFKIVRDEIHVPSVESKMLPRDSIGYVALNQFGEGSIDELRAAFVDLQKKGMKSAVLDLRGNGGGYLEGAVDLVSLFARSGNVVSVEHRSGPAEKHAVTGHPLFPDLPLVVLQNEGSASASEIVAGALQDLGRATIVGMKSFGKGTVQEVIDLPSGGSLRVTVAHWLTPKGKNLGKEGVHPDIEVPLTADDVRLKRDPQLDAATLWLTQHRKPAKTASSAASIIPASGSGQ